MKSREGWRPAPTESSEIDEYASAVEFRDSYFVLGYGLEDGEEIMLETAERIITTEKVGGTRFFVIELTSSPGAESFEIPIGTPDGIVRSTPSHGVDP